MTRSTVNFPQSYYPDFDKGKPLSSAYIYIGEPDLDPEIVANQKDIYFVQEDGTEIAGIQPVRTSAGGVPTYNGSRVTVRVAGDYSIKVLNSASEQVYYSPNTNADETILGGFVPTVATLAALLSASTDTDWNVKSYFNGWAAYLDEPLGGGRFFWDATRAKSEHNGVTIFSPTVPWDGNTGSSHTDFLNGVGETDGAGSGCWVRRDDGELLLSMAGARGDGAVNDTPAIQAALGQSIRVYGEAGQNYRLESGITLSTTYQTLDLRRAVMTPVGTFDMCAISSSYSGIINGRINAAGLTGRVIYNTTAIQHFRADDLEILNPNATTAVELKDVFTTWVQRLQVTGHAGTAFHAYSSISGTPVNSLWLNECNFSGGTGATDSVLLEAIAGSWVTGCSFQNNASGGTDIRVKSTVNAGVSGLTIERNYFETGISLSGNCIHVGDPTSGSNDHLGVEVKDNYFQGSKLPVLVGTNVNDDMAVVENTFVSVTGSPSFAVSTTQAINCHSNSGSQSDIDRTFTPALQFGGASTGLTTSAANGKYRRIDGKVTGEIELILTAKGSSTGSATVSGLPIASSASSFRNIVNSPLYFNMASISGGIFGRVDAGGTTINLSTGGAAAHTDVTEAMFTDTTNLYLAFEYEI